MMKPYELSKFTRKTAALFMAAAMTGSFAACSGGNTQPKTDAASGDKTQSAAGSPVQFTYWTPYTPHEKASLSETPMYQELMKRLDMQIEFQHPPAGQAKEQFNLLLASGDLPDIIEWTWYSYPGGPEKALTEGHIIPLDLEKAPHLSKILAEHPDVEKGIKTDTGKFFSFPFLRFDEETKITFGPMIRRDILKELGLEMPETIDEWYQTLKTIKEKHPEMVPLCIAETSLVGHGFMGAYGVNSTYFMEDGKVKASILEPGYQDFLKEMNKWYQEGLLDPDSGAIEDKQANAKLISGEAAATLAFAGSGLGQYLSSSSIEGYDMAPTVYPTLNKGETVKLSEKAGTINNGYCAAITKDCKNVDAAYRLLDYAYSEEGDLLFNFGIEGETYTMADGVPTYTELITKNPDGMTMAEALRNTTRCSQSASMIQSGGYSRQYYKEPQQQEAFAAWGKTLTDAYNIPMVTPTPEESSELARLQNELDTYRDEMVWKFILGTESFDNYGKFIDQVKSMGIERIVEIKQAALDRYNAR